MKSLGLLIVRDYGGQKEHKCRNLPLLGRNWALKLN